MSWAGKQSIGKFFRSLFRKEQAPSDSASPRTVKPLSPAQVAKLETKLNVWVEKRGYCRPDKTIKESAAHIGTDSVKIYRYFQMKGSDFRSWRMELRMRDAMEQMIREPETSVSAIGLRVGIPDRSNFCRQFKTVTGQTPEVWRNNQKIILDN